MIGRIAALAVAGFLAIGALLPGQRLQVVLRGDAETPPLPVAVDDGSGLVTFVGAGIDDGSAPGIAAVEGRRNAIAVGWVGGLCDQSARISIQPYNDQIHLHRSTTSASSDCLLIGISRSVVIEFREPVDPARVVDTSDWLYSGG